MALDRPATWGAALHIATVNGITIRWADTAVSAADRSKPVVLMMHGWPESWFSWRHQLKALNAAGYRAVAPDMRGYGGTDAPSHFGNYSVYTLAADMIALLAHLGVRKAALVGHDHGAMTGWQLSLLHPEIFVCYYAMSVPYHGRGKRPPLATLRSLFGDERKRETDPSYFYMLHHNLPEASDDYARGTRETLTLLYSEGAADGEAAVTSRKMFVNGKSEAMWRRARPGRCLSPWISQVELDYYVHEFEKNGWNGGLNWYRVMDANWYATPQLAGAHVQQPTGFCIGTDDVVMKMSGGVDAVKAALEETCEGRCEVTIVEGVGHWIQQEAAMEVNNLLLAFLGKHRALFDTHVSKL